MVNGLPIRLTIPPHRFKRLELLDRFETIFSRHRRTDPNAVDGAVSMQSKQFDSDRQDRLSIPAC
jgi:hypothetical protein